MDGVRARTPQHRAISLYRPERELFGWACYLAVTVGLVCAAAQQAHADGNPGWLLTFATLTAAVTTAYAWVVHALYCAWNTTH